LNNVIRSVKKRFYNNLVNSIQLVFNKKLILTRAVGTGSRLVLDNLYTVLCSF
jgi:hypothetical protein